LRYPDSLSHLILFDTGGDSRWQQQNGPEILAKRGYSPRTVRLARRFYNGQIAPWEMVPALMFRFGTAYYHRPFSPGVALELVRERHAKARGEAWVFAAVQLYKGWSVIDRLGEIEVPTLVMAGRDDFQFPPECQVELAAGIPNAHLEIIERAGHNAQAERPDEVMQAVRGFTSANQHMGTAQ
jgi:proline iminopeptidase